METSILFTIKKLLGLEADYTPFDTDIIVYINGALMILRQLGVGPATGFAITGPDETWADYLGDDLVLLESVKNYIYLKTRIVWDSGLSSSLMDTIQRQISEYEWRLNVEVDPSAE